MRVSCPSCNALLTLDVLLTNEAARLAVARLAKVSLPFGALTLQYMALFRPETRGLSIDRMVKLVEELLPDIERQAITRKGRDWDTTIETWRAALQTVLAKRDAGSLRLPLTSHGLLYEVIAGMVDKYEGRMEAAAEQQRRNHRPAGLSNGPRDLAEMAEAIGAEGPAALAAPRQAAPAYSGPSKAALAIQAQIKAHQERRAALDQADGTQEAIP